jgi:GH25 family lysozyme M1 (1,4-beta-N-acetylmuramidase)
MIRGVDVASYQGPPGNWVSVAGRIRWAAVKVTELEPNGVKYVNPYALDDWTYLGKNNLGRVAYLFGHPSTSATDTVEFFAQNVRGLGFSDTDAMALDLEVTDGLDPAEVDKWAAHVMADLHDRLHRRPALYTFLELREPRQVPAVDRGPVESGRAPARPGAVEDLGHAPVRHLGRHRPGYRPVP